MTQLELESSQAEGVFLTHGKVSPFMLVGPSTDLIGPALMRGGSNLLYSSLPDSDVNFI